MAPDYGQHFLLAFWSLILGFFLGFVCDLVRLAFYRGRVKAYFRFLIDLLFTLFCSLAFMLLFFNLSYGIMRAYAFVIAAVGFWLWRITLGRLYKKAYVFVDGILNVARILFRKMRMFVEVQGYRVHTRIYCKISVTRAAVGYDLLKDERDVSKWKKTGSDEVTLLSE